MSAESTSWKLSLPCTKAEARAIAEADAPLGDIDPPPVLMTSEPDPATPDAWQLDAYHQQPFDPATIAAIRALVPSAKGGWHAIEELADEDWVTLSQAGLAPIRAGRFHITTPAHAGDVPAGTIPFTIEAGRAFGTGHHETTTGCLLMLDRLARTGSRFRNIADVGTGTGLLAFAARALWPTARTIASDIDPIAIEVAAENAAVNAIPTGRGRDAVELVTAAGLAHPRLKARAPYDLLIANILAGPLIELAPVLAAALAPGGSLILAGLLGHQAEPVAAAYRARGLRLADTTVTGDWPALRLTRKRVYAAARVTGASGTA